MPRRGDAHAGAAGREQLTGGARRLLFLLGLLCPVGFASSAAVKVSVTKNEAVFAALSGTKCVATLTDKGSTIARAPAGLLSAGWRATRSQKDASTERRLELLADALVAELYGRHPPAPKGAKVGDLRVVISRDALLLVLTGALDGLAPLVRRYVLEGDLERVEARNLPPLALLDQLRALPDAFFYTIHRNCWPVALADAPGSTLFRVTPLGPGPPDARHRRDGHRDGGRFRPKRLRRRSRLFTERGSSTGHFGPKARFGASFADFWVKAFDLLSHPLSPAGESSRWATTMTLARSVYARSPRLCPLAGFGSSD
ncbi:hypothetical protein T492DRAFT_872536 [Pavlovales sp. CCMP2436]|nr:hypothetical protein T492DRAFT_872536 [Pavlovales sp. CCMP2436]